MPFLFKLWTRNKPPRSAQQAELLPTQEEQVPAKSTITKTRQIDSDGDAEPLTKRARLTRKKRRTWPCLTRWARRRSRDPTDDSTSGFCRQSLQERDPPPTSLQTTHEPRRHRRQHASASRDYVTSESVFEGYANRVGKAGNEATVVVETGGKLLKEYRR